MNWELDLAGIRNEFSHLDRWLFLNHAGVSPLPRRVVAAMTCLLEDVAANGGANEPEWAKREADLRRMVAQLLHCDASEIALTKNTSECISIVANGIDWTPGDNLIIANVEFPSNVYPWLGLERHGVQVRFVKERAGRIELDAVEALVDSRTRAVALSLVEYASGFRIPAEEIGAFCRRNGIIFVLDAFQAAGAIRVDAQALQAEAIAGAFHKWLLGPEGIGYLYVRKDAMERIAVTEFGWKSVTVPYTEPRYALELKGAAERYECGTLNTPGIFGAAAAVEWNLAIGPDEIERRLIELTDYLCAGLRKRGYVIFSPRGMLEKSGIVSFRHPSHPTDELVKLLCDRRIVVRERAGCVRVAPHFYNTEEEIDKLLSALP